MLTVDELLAAYNNSDDARSFQDVNDIIHIDPVTRQLLVPNTEFLLGVESDEKSECKFFGCPRYIGNNIDVAQCTISIVFRNANREKDLFVVNKVAYDDNTVIFCWELSRKVTKYKGDVNFLIWMYLSEDGNITKEWHTALSSGVVYEGLHADESYNEESKLDILVDLTKMAVRAEAAMVVAEDAAARAYESAQSVDAEFLNTRIASKGDNLYFDEGTGLLYLMSDGQIIGDGIHVITTGGGGGGGSLNYVISLTNLLNSRIFTVSEGTKVELRFNYSSIDEEGFDDGPGVGKLIVNNVTKQTFTMQQGDNSIDATAHLASGSNSVKVQVENSEGAKKTLNYTITIAAAHLASAFDVSTPFSGPISFTYTPTGIADKTVHFELDGKEIGSTVVTTSGRQQSYIIPTQSHGAHNLRVWFDCLIEGNTVTSNILNFVLICIEEGNMTPIVAVNMPLSANVEQFTSIVTKYRVYNPAGLTAVITLEVNGDVVSTQTVDRTEQTWTYRPNDVGELVQTIRCGDEFVSWTQTVIESSIKVDAETEALALYLSSYGRSNNEEAPAVWEFDNISADFQNFNFVSDGWVQDDDDNTVLRVSGDARLFIPYRIFAYDFRTTGKTLEFELATREVLNYDTEIINCFSADRGFSITAQQLQLVSEQSMLGTRYKEDEHIRVTFVVEKKSGSRLLMCYINGILSGAVQYPENDNFSQTNPVGITIGSNDCTTDLYNIRAYDNDLTRYQILDNWIADTQNQADKSARFLRNNIYDAYGRIVIPQLPNDLPYLVIQSTELPQFKGDKKSFSGYFVDPSGKRRNFTFDGAQIDVQGTSSQYYYVKNYKTKYKNGFVLSDGSIIPTYPISSNAVPVDTFTMKADVASSEGAFNVVLAMLYNDYCPFKTPAQEANPKVRQTIEGFPIVIFWDNGTSDLKFLGKYNFNNDKGTAETFGFAEGDESWEILQNGTERVGWHSADFSDSGWKDDFEARYPEDNVDTTRLQALAEWLVSTDTDQATNAIITPVTYNGVEYTADTVEYRLAKFDAELADHFVVEAIEFYYLFTEIFLSIDQREKNAFPTYIKALDRWIVLFYDADSSCGTDNKGNLSFDYYLEDIDYTEAGDPVYNGQNSVLWKNLRATRYDEIMAMYKELRTRTEGKLSYEATIGRFEEHQSKWPEAIFNEDMYRKCIEPLVETGDGLYLPMLQGKKEQWMKWWLYNRFRYLDSKYETGTSMTNRITIRAHQKANVFLKSYVNMYGHVYFNAALVEHRMERGVEYEFEWPASGAEDPVIGINDADLLTSLGDLSPLMVELIDVSGAPHISELKVGDGAEDYTNYSLNSITLGNNKLLRTLDLRNCVNLTQSVNLSGCTNIDEAYLEGTSVTGIELPNGGTIKTLHLPGTVKNLTLRNLSALSDFQLPSYNQITTLWLENMSHVVDPFEIMYQMAPGNTIRLIGFEKTVENASEIMDLIAFLDTMHGRDENNNITDYPQVSGTIYVGELTTPELNAIREAQTRYPSLAVVFVSIKTYTVKFYNYNGLLLETVSNVAWGSTVEYGGAMPSKPNASVNEDWRFNGWSPAPVNVTEDMECVAQFRNAVATTRLFISRTLSGQYEHADVTKIRDYAFSRGGNLTSVSFPNVVSIGYGAFSGQSSLASVNFPAVKTIGTLAFLQAGPLTDFNMPNVTDIGYQSFCQSKAPTLCFPSRVTISSYAFQSSVLAALILPNAAVSILSHTNAFSSSPVASGTGYIYVPATLVDSYKAASNWSTYANQIRAIEDYPEICGGE